MHELWIFGGNCIDFLVLPAPAALVFNLACEDDVGGVLIRELILNGSDCWSGSRLLGGWRRWGGRRRRHQPLALGDRVSQWHFRFVWLDGFAPLWNLQGASRVCL